MKKLVLFTLLLSLSGVMAMAQTLKDPATYAPTASGEKLTNLYLNSAGLAGGSPIYPGGVSGDARGMAVVNDKMYFSNRTTGNPVISSLVEVDGLTGAYLRNILLPIEMWMEPGVGGAVADTVPYLANDVQVDDANNLYVSNMILDMRGEGPSHTYKVNYIDVTKSPITWKTVLSATIPADLGAAFRIDAFDVYGDVLNGNGLIMLAVAGADVGAGNTVIKYKVTNGVADVANPEFIVLQEFNPKTATTSGTAPRVNIVDETLFYHDGFNTVPMLYDMNGNAVDGFQNNVALSPATGPNGITEFEMNGEYYMICASVNTDKTPPQAFDIFKYKDASRSFADMTFLYRFPEAGMGTVSNPVRTALPRVEVVDGDNGLKKARINLYAYRNGYGIYEFTKVGTGLFGAKYNSFALTVEGRNIIVKEEVTSIALYSLTGQRVKEVVNTQTITAPAAGVYVVTVLDKSGEKKVEKVVVR